jgi:ABC-type multidrug transport system ATPase subunit
VLHTTDLRLMPGEFVALIGEAGSGKSTLLKILAGVTRPSVGSVLIDGEELALRLPDVGYVPQADILHRSLTAREALTYGARLRLPPDTRPAEIDGVVKGVLHDLDLAQHADRQIGTGLSGGQQRSVGVGMELLGSPRILLLDEPGASLDLRLERQLMEVLRRVVQRNCAVLAITHRTTFLRQFDRVLVMGRGGVLRFDGTPSEALRFFAISDFDAIYDKLAEAPPPEPGGARRTSPPARPTGVAPSRPRPAFAHQLRVLTGRTTRVFSRDRRNVTLLLAQAPVLAAGVAVLFGKEAFAPGHPLTAAQLLFALAIVLTWVGAVNGVRALISERAMFVRERALGVRAGPYLASKLLVLGTLGLLQTALLAWVAFTIAPLHRGELTYAVVVGLLVLATQAALSTGLLLSALVSTSDQAGSLLPLLLVPQFLCAGAIVAVKAMGPLKPLSLLVSARWTFAGTGSAVALPGRSPQESFYAFYGNFFSLPWIVSAVVLLALICVTVALTWWRLRVAWR